MEFKGKKKLQAAGYNYGLIESDWNLKYFYTYFYNTVANVLIESDWNLKQKEKTLEQKVQERINRIRLEFKVFRAGRCGSRELHVLIESDWNLKLNDTIPVL